MSEGLAAAEDILVFVNSSSFRAMMIYGHELLPRAIHGSIFSAASGVYVDVHSPYYCRGVKEIMYIEI